MSNVAQAAVPAVSAVDIRRATLLYTEGGFDNIRNNWQSVVDVDRVVENRIISSGKDSDSVATAPGQFAKIQELGTRGFLSIRTWEDAARYSGGSVSALQDINKARRNPILQQNSRDHVGGATGFRSSEENYKTLVNTSQRYRGQPGGRFHNQFLTGPKDSKIKLPDTSPPPVVPTIRKTEDKPFGLHNIFNIFSKGGDQSLIPNWSDKDKYGNKPNPKPIKHEDFMPLPGPFKKA
jgi:hypothetical protein